MTHTSPDHREIIRLKRAHKAYQQKLDLTEAFLEAPQTGPIDGATNSRNIDEACHL
jgi:hypothetical protein